jgi:hypothetical protein
MRSLLRNALLPTCRLAPSDVNVTSDVAENKEKLCERCNDVGAKADDDASSDNRANVENMIIVAMSSWMSPTTIVPLMD